MKLVGPKLVSGYLAPGPLKMCGWYLVTGHWLARSDDVDDEPPRDSEESLRERETKGLGDVNDVPYGALSNLFT